MPSSASERHLRTQLGELEQRYVRLTRRLAALETDIGRALDGEHKLVLEERREDLVAERDQVAGAMGRIEEESAGLRGQGSEITAGPEVIETDPSDGATGDRHPPTTAQG